jgi:hypothetical protein
VSCYPTVTNNDTGDSQTFTAESTSIDCATATLDCYGKAIKKALAYSRSAGADKLITLMGMSKNMRLNNHKFHI